MSVDQRFFRSSPQVYEAMRQELDAAFGYPDGVTETVWNPLASAIRDSQGRCVLSVRGESCNRPQVAAVLPTLLENGSVEEIDEATYMAAMTPAE